MEGETTHPSARGVILTLALSIPPSLPPSLPSFLTEELIFLRDVSFDVYPRTLTVLFGATGAGKSGLLSALIGEEGGRREGEPFWHPLFP